MKGEKKRLQFDFSDGALRRLDEIVANSDAASRAEVVRRALELYDYMREWKLQGRRLVLRAADGSEQELVILGA